MDYVLRFPCGEGGATAALGALTRSVVTRGWGAAGDAGTRTRSEGGPGSVPTSSGDGGGGGAARTCGEKARVRSDRAFNAKSAFNARAAAFLGFEPVSYVEYDPSQPDRVTVRFATQGPDGRSLPPRRIELYVNGRSSELVREPGGQEAFVAWELYRQVLLGVRDVDVTGAGCPCACLALHSAVALSHARVAAKRPGQV